MGESCSHKYCGKCGICICPNYCEHCNKMFCDKCFEEHKKEREDFVKRLIESTYRNMWSHCYLHIQDKCNDYGHCGKLAKCEDAKKIANRNLREIYKIKVED